MSSLSSSMWFARSNRRRVRRYDAPRILWPRRAPESHDDDNDNDEPRSDVQIDDTPR